MPKRLDVRLPHQKVLSSASLATRDGYHRERPQGCPYGVARIMIACTVGRPIIPDPASPAHPTSPAAIVYTAR